MNNYLARTISTAAVWLATTIIFTFGVFRFSWTGVFPGMVWTLVALALAIAPTVATYAIWMHQSTDNVAKSPSDKPPEA